MAEFEMDAWNKFRDYHMTLSLNPTVREIMLLGRVNDTNSKCPI